MENHRVASHDEWLEKRLQLLKKEKELTRLRDELSSLRRQLPWVAVVKNYRFTDGNGTHSLSDLFGNCSQLIVYHFMFGPDWDEGCTSCSWWADNLNGLDVHLAHRDIAFAAISRAPIEKLDAYRERLGWTFRWLSSNGNDFNFDYRVSFDDQAKSDNRIHYNYVDQDGFMDELPGVSVFAKDAAGHVHRTYSTYSRGLDILNGAYHLIDLTPAGRNEENGMSWLRRHDSYEEPTEHTP